MKTILLDFGHGYTTPGKRSPVWEDGTQLLEWEFNRAVGTIIESQLELRGYECEILVPEFKDIPLSERVRRANTYNDAILVSIHGNAYGVESVSGFEVFTYTNASQLSKEMAQIMWNEFKEHGKFKMRADWSDGNPDKSAKFTILSSKHPSILTESGFYTNKKDCDYMLSVVGQNEIAAIHTQAIIKFLDNHL